MINANKINKTKGTNKMNSKLTKKYIKSISSELKMEIANFDKHCDGFSFTVKTELEAYKAAYKYRFVEETWVTKCAGCWVVRVI